MKLSTDLFGANAAPVLRSLLSASVQTKDMMAATLYDHQGQQAWHLLMMHPDDFRENGKYVGLLAADGKDVIQIVPVRKLEGQKNWSKDIVGFEFRHEDRSLAAVELLNQGRVWIDETLPEDSRTVLAAACATMLLKQEIDLASEKI